MMICLLPFKCFRTTSTFKLTWVVNSDSLDDFGMKRTLKMVVVTRYVTIPLITSVGLSYPKEAAKPTAVRGSVNIEFDETDNS